MPENKIPFYSIKLKKIIKFASIIKIFSCFFLNLESKNVKSVLKI